MKLSPLSAGMIDNAWTDRSANYMHDKLSPIIQNMTIAPVSLFGLTGAIVFERAVYEFI